MTEERMMYLATKDIVDNLPEADRDKVYAIAAEMRQRIASDGNHATMAVALVCCELNAGVNV